MTTFCLLSFITDQMDSHSETRWHLNWKSEKEKVTKLRTMPHLNTRWREKCSGQALLRYNFSLWLWDKTLAWRGSHEDSSRIKKLLCGLHGSGEDSKVSLRIKRKIWGFQEGVDGLKETVMIPIEQWGSLGGGPGSEDQDKAVMVTWGQ